MSLILCPLLLNGVALWISEFNWSNQFCFLKICTFLLHLLSQDVSRTNLVRTLHASASSRVTIADFTAALPESSSAFSTSAVCSSQPCSTQTQEKELKITVPRRVQKSVLPRATFWKLCNGASSEPWDTS